MIPGDQRVAVRDGELKVHRWGEGAPVLMVHGVLTYSFVFEPLRPFLEGDYRLIVPDLLGCGDSDHVEADLSIGAHAGRILELLDALDTGPVHLVAHDVGGGIAQLLALDAPERFLSLTLINPVGYDYWPVPAVEALRAPILRQFVMASFDWGTLRAMIRHGLADPKRLDDALFEQFERPFRERAGRQSFLCFLRGLDSTELTDRANELPRISLPTLILRGERDRYLRETITRRLSEDIPGARLEVIARCGHFAMHDAPGQIARLLRAHLERHAGSGT